MHKLQRQKEGQEERGNTSCPGVSSGLASSVSSAAVTGGLVAPSGGPGARPLTLEVHDLRKRGQQGCLPGCLFGGLQMLRPDNDCCCLAVITA